MSLLWLQENILGFSRFFDDTEDGLQETKDAIQERLCKIREAGWHVSEGSLWIVRIQAGTVIDDHGCDTTELVYQHTEEEEDEEDEEGEDTNQNQ